MATRPPPPPQPEPEPEPEPELEPEFAPPPPVRSFMVTLSPASYRNDLAPPATATTSARPCF